MQATPMLPEAAVGIAVADHKMPWMAFSSVHGASFARHDELKKPDRILIMFAAVFFSEWQSVKRVGGAQPH
ncbi:hypothetical protein R0I78_05090 [Oceanimonas sp. CAM02]|nr:hypothetical protein [Oceanimonas sp. CAM02]